MKQQILPIKIKNLPPIKLRLSDIVIFFNHFEKAILKLAENNIELNISLIGIQNSIDTTFLTTSLQFAEYKKAYTMFTSYIEKLWEKKCVPPLILGHLKEIVNLTRKRNLEIEFEDEMLKPLASLTPETPLPVPYLKGYAEIWGIIEKVGGKEPHIVVRLLNNKTITVKVKETQAKEIANYLYEKIKIKGVGTWNYTGELIELQAEKIEPIHTLTREKIEEIRKELGKYWKGFDVEKALRELRAD